MNHYELRASEKSEKTDILVLNINVTLNCIHVINHYSLLYNTIGEHV